MKEKYNGNIPINARIKIDYQKNKPKVSFSYPHKKYQQAGSMFMYLFAMNILILCFLYDFTSFHYENNESYLLRVCNLEQLEKYNFYKTEEFSGLCENKIFDKNIIGKFLFLWTIIKSERFIFSTFFGYFITIFIYYPFRKKIWYKVYPKFQAFFSDKKLRIFSPNDVFHDDKYGYYCEIPVFNNVVLNYTATKDFSKYMNMFEIREHKFVYYKKKPKKMNKRRFNKWKSKTINEWIWYARFYFSNKPSKGKLEVLFK
jgi:hypothetical protein